MRMIMVHEQLHEVPSPLSKQLFVLPAEGACLLRPVFPARVDDVKRGEMAVGVIDRPDV